MSFLASLGYKYVILASLGYKYVILDSVVQKYAADLILVSKTCRFPFRRGTLYLVSKIEYF